MISQRPVIGLRMGLDVLVDSLASGAIILHSSEDSLIVCCHPIWLGDDLLAGVADGGAYYLHFCINTIRVAGGGCMSTQRPLLKEGVVKLVVLALLQELIHDLL